MEGSRESRSLAGRCPAGGCGGWRRCREVVAKFERGPISERVAFRGVGFVAKHGAESGGFVTQVEMVAGPPERVGVADHNATVRRGKRFWSIRGLKNNFVFVP